MANNSMTIQLNDCDKVADMHHTVVHLDNGDVMPIYIQRSWPEPGGEGKERVVVKRNAWASSPVFEVKLKKDGSFKLSAAAVTALYGD